MKNNSKNNNLIFFFKGVIILMTLEFKDDFNPISRQKDVTKLVERYLIDVWSADVNEDQIKPLLTRIANNIIHVVKGSCDFSTII